MTTTLPNQRVIAFCLTTVAGCLPGSAPSANQEYALVVAFDGSMSVDDGSCRQISSRLALTAGGEPFHFLLLQSGSVASKFEPITLFPWSTRRPDAVLFEEPDVAYERRTRWIDELIQECRQRLRRVDETSVYRLVARAIQSVRAKCRKLEASGNRCSPEVYIHSDGLETSSRAVRRFIDAHRRGQTPPLGRIKPIDAQGIRVEFCGLSETRGRARALADAPPDAVMQAWSKLITPPPNSHQRAHAKPLLTRWNDVWPVQVDHQRTRRKFVV